MGIRFFFRASAGVIAMAGLIAGGCGKADPDRETAGLTPVVLQTDWFPQPEHGGFYQALAKGYYREAGLEVTLLPGGPNAMSTQKVLKGSAHFAMNRADTVYSLASRGVPIVMVMATLQHDPQAIMMHDVNPVDSFEDLDGKRVMAVPGLTWIDWLEAKYDIEMEIIPHDFGLQRFLNDTGFIQQCLLTNEPFYVRQGGVEPKLLPLRDSGFDPYHGIYCLREYAKANPDTVTRFVAASIRGWKDFILGDPTPAFDLIAAHNPKMNPEFMAFSHRALKDHKLVTGPDPSGRQIGQLDPRRMRDLVREMHALGLVEEPPSEPHPWFTSGFLSSSLPD